jgi:ATP-binding cassette subfamily B protein
MVAKHYGKNISLQTLREKTQIGKEGVNLLGISEASETIGFRTQALKLTYGSLTKEAKLPAILHWNQDHFVVLYKARKKKLHVADPAIGLTIVTEKEFKTYWISSKEEGEKEGVALLLEPSPQFYDNMDEAEERKSKGLKFKNIFNYILPYKKLVFQLFVGLAVASLLQLFLPFLTQSVVDTGVNTANIHFVYIVLLAQLALFAGRLVIEFVRGWILLHISARINISILTDFLIKLMKLTVSFFDSKHTGDILQRMNDHSRIESFLTGSSLSVLFSLINLIIFSIVLAIFNVGIFAVFVIASIFYSLWVIVFLKKRRVLDYKRFAVAAKEQSITIQLVQGMQEIKLNGVEKSMRWTWEGLQAKLFRLSMKGPSLNQCQQAGAFFINEGKNILITFLSAKADVMLDISNGRTDSCSMLHYDEAKNWISAMNSKRATSNPPATQNCQRMTNSVIAMAHEMRWITRVEIVEADGKLTFANDYSQLDEWMISYSYMKKPLKKYKYEELPKLVFQFKNVYFSWLKKNH